MTIANWLTESIKKLDSKSIPSSKLDAEVLLSDILDHDRTWIHAHPEFILQRSDLRILDKQIERRMTYEPLAYIRGFQEFYGRDFIVTNDVHVPRPESESFIELLKPPMIIKPPKGIHNVLDMGTGSGILAITAKLEFPHLNLFATDTNKETLKIAIENAQKLNATVRFKMQSLLEGDKEGYDVILANLPYVPQSMQDISIMKEPKEALFSGTDGLEHYRKLFEKLKPKHIRYLMSESLESQHNNLAGLAKDAGYKLVETNGLVQLFKRD